MAARNNSSRAQVIGFSPIDSAAEWTASFSAAVMGIRILKAAVSLHVAHYNFCWRLREKGKSGKLTPTPAEQAGLTNHQWSIEELYQIVMDFQEYQKLQHRVKQLAKKLGF